MRLIVGLGNPGRLYAHNRHNMGFQCLDAFARAHGIRFDRLQGQARVAVGEVAGISVVLAKPRTFMNRSGKAVKALVKRYNLPLGDLLVLYDDLDLPLGKIRLRERGGAGGHKGMRSILEHLQSQDFPRLRVGIAPLPGEDAPRVDIETPDFVLSDFAAEEKPLVREVCQRVAQVILVVLTEGMALAMNKFN